MLSGFPPTTEERAPASARWRPRPTVSPRRRRGDPSRCRCHRRHGAETAHGVKFRALGDPGSEYHRGDCSREVQMTATSHAEVARRLLANVEAGTSDQAESQMKVPSAVYRDPQRWEA